MLARGSDFLNEMSRYLRPSPPPLCGSAASNFVHPRITCRLKNPENAPGTQTNCNIQDRSVFSAVNLLTCQQSRIRLKTPIKPQLFIFILHSLCGFQQIKRKTVCVWPEFTDVQRDIIKSRSKWKPVSYQKSVLICIKWDLYCVLCTVQCMRKQHMISYRESIVPNQFLVDLKTNKQRHVVCLLKSILSLYGGTFPFTSGTSLIPCLK